MDDLRALLDKATPGPWFHGHRTHNIDARHGDGRVGSTYDDERGQADAALIVAAVNALPALLDVVEAARLLMAMHSQMGPQFEPHDEIELRAALARLEETPR